MIKIDGIEYDIKVTSLKQEGTFVDKSAERTEDWDLQREVAGLFFNYRVKLGDIQNKEVAYDFFNKICEVVDFHTVELPHNDGTLTFKAYVTGVTRNLLKYKENNNKWGGYEVRFIAKEPQFRP